MEYTTESGKPGFLGQLGAVKLRRATVEHDYSAPKLKDVLENQEVVGWHNKVLDINMEEWLHLIPSETFYTEFYELTVDDAKTFVAAYEAKHVHKPPTDLSDEMKRILSNAEVGLQRVIDSVKSHSKKVTDCVFVKTSCRSAKDTVVYDEQMRLQFRKFLQQKGDILNENNQFAAVLEAAVDLLKVRSAHDVMQNFVNSERVYNDMKLALEYPDRFKQNFVVREWVDITPDMEFRGFVKGGKLNALSQYNHPVMWPRVVAHHNEIVARIQDFFYSQVAPKLANAFDEYVVDFAVCGDALDHVWVIELNPYAFTTDACLFSWQAEKNIFDNGPFEFRYREKEFSGSKAGLSDEWARLISSEVIRLKNANS